MSNDRCHAPGECFCDRCCLQIVNDNLCNYISKASLPKLPEGWEGPFEATGRIVWGHYLNGRVAFASDFADRDEAAFLAALLNACYPNQENDR